MKSISEAFLYTFTTDVYRLQHLLNITASKSRHRDANQQKCLFQALMCANKLSYSWETFSCFPNPQKTPCINFPNELVIYYKTHGWWIKYIHYEEMSPKSYWRLIKAVSCLCIGSLALTALLSANWLSLISVIWISPNYISLLWKRRFRDKTVLWW